MNANDYQQSVLRTAPLTSGFLKTNLSVVTEQLLHAQLGITTELGEFSDPIKRKIIYGQTLDISNIQEECGDMLWYIALALNAIECSLEDCMQGNIDKLKIRYPEKFTEELAKERLDKKSYCKICGHHGHILEECPEDTGEISDRAHI